MLEGVDCIDMDVWECDMTETLNMCKNYAKRSVIGHVMVMDMLNCKLKKRMLLLKATHREEYFEAISKWIASI